MLETTPTSTAVLLRSGQAGSSAAEKLRVRAKSTAPQLDGMNPEVPMILACTTRPSRLETPNSHYDVAAADSKDVL